MEQVVLLRSNTAMRAEPAERSEMVSQWLFGELATLLEESGKWVKIRLDVDGYEGWVDANSARKVNDHDLLVLKKAGKHRMLSTTGSVLRDGNVNILIPAGSPVPVLFGDSFELIGRPFHLTGGRCGLLSLSGESLVSTAQLFLGTPYLWGGRTQYGIDCSGFSQILYLMHGITLPRDASQQINHGEEVSFVQETKPGDLAFFHNEEGRIVHVGMVLKPGTIIHASGEVRIDTLDSTGIYNAAQARYTHQLRLIKRYC
jgi:hypothetical protein